jgi:hypothetical protein
MRRTNRRSGWRGRGPLDGISIQPCAVFQRVPPLRSFYVWTDIPTDCEFILDYEDDEDEADAGSGKKGRQKKKSWRYRWPDEVRDEVLARLLKLNKERFEEEVRLGLHALGKGKSTKTKKTKSINEATLDFEEGEPTHE